MNFSELFKQSNQLCRLSPDGRYSAVCVQYRLVIRDARTLQVLHLYTCLDQIQYVEWSADSLFILCAMYKRGLVQVWSLEQPDWHCKIDEGSAGLVASRWSPDGRHILNTTEFHLRITVWSLCTKSVSYIKYPKTCQHGMDFTKNGHYMALAERRDCKDHISIFVCSEWQLLRHFETETQDLAGIEWSPNSCVLAVWDSCLEYKILLYSLDGRLLSTYSAYEWSLGVKSVAWSPSSQLLAIGSYDEKVRMLNHVTWGKLAELEHLPTIRNPKSITAQRMEFLSSFCWGTITFSMLSLLIHLSVSDEICQPPVELLVVKPDADRANPKLGVGMLAFSPDNRFLATRNDNLPNTVWIWDVQKLKQYVVLEQLSAVKSFQWDPCRTRLAICTGSNKVYLWSPAGCLTVQIPAEGSFQVLSLHWHPNGESIMLLSKDQMCVCYLDTADES
ncbi:WD repeat-containing protein WRAP73 [Chiloscyllium plagiosum]|uniref:WD repeat-containing protein WRAP73 n=1 Tax=Chiloscyllium plagiosum TaxID=36176 RepID=UPI001CB86954|nr:WD repeat-containing protein WRAP73 [Chiloscyllium plagiosum]